MSGVGSTNAMKKGSANNPFLAYSEADMASFLNSAYTGCIVKYAGEPISRYLAEQNKTVPEHVKNLVFSPTDGGFWTFFSNGNMRIKIQQKTNGSTKTLYITPGRYYNGAWHFDKNDFTNGNLYLTDSLTAPAEIPIAIQEYFSTEPYWRWNKECVNDQGNLIIWTHDQDVTFTIEQATTEYDIAYDSTHGITIVPYKVNELYKVVYGDGKYHYEEFYHISGTRTTANSDYIAPGKTAFDFTGNLQTGNGSKINPYIASTADEMAAYLTSSYKGAFVKYVGDTVAVGGTSIPFSGGETSFSDATGVYINKNLDALAIKNAMAEIGSSFDISAEFRTDSESITLYVMNSNGVLVMLISETLTPIYAETAVEIEGISFVGGFENISENGDIAGFAPTQSYIDYDATQIFELFVSKTPFTSGGGESYVKNAIYQVAEDGDTTRYAILPTLSNPGTAADLAQGKQLIDGEGKVVEGEAAFSFGDYSVKVIDYDGTVLMEKKGNTGDIIDLPIAPVHDKLVFQVWSASVDVSNNKVTIADNDIMVGAVYTTTSGQNEFDITLTKATGLSVTLSMDGTKYWGDGTSDTETTHTYTAYGDYTIKCNGTTMTTSSSSGLFGQSGNVYNYYCKKARLVTNISDYAFYNCRSLINIVISNDVTNLGNNALNSCYSLTNIIISNSVTSIGERVFSQCSSLTKIVIPNSVTSITQYMFSSCSSLTNIVIPNSVTYINTNAFYSCSSLTNIIIPNSVIRISDYAFQFCYSLKKIIIPSSVTGLYSDVFADCYSLTSIVIPSSVTNLYSELFYKCYSLTSIVIPSSVTRIRNYTFAYCSSILKYDFSSHTSVPTLQDSNAFYSINALCKIIVPDSLYDEWIAAPYWSNYADYIYKASEEVTQ